MHSHFNYLCGVSFLIKAKGVKNIPQNATESVEELQTLRHGSLKRRHPSEDKGDPWFLHEPGKKFIKPFHRFTRFIYPVRKTTPDNEGISRDGKCNMHRPWINYEGKNLIKN